MKMHTLACCAAAVLVMDAPIAVSADSACCDKNHEQQCCKMAVCCEQKDDPAAVAVLIPQVEPEPRPVREAMVVRFWTPVKVGDRILLGKYIIEHDNNLMARGEPCTHIYEASGPRLPVVRFHCTHLNRPLGERTTVTLRPLGGANGTRELTEFQFAGEKGAHGVPGVR